MPLDMFQQAQSDTNAYVQRNNAARLPATFGDTFDAAFNENRLFGQSIAGENSRAAALGDYMDEVARKTGEQFADLPYELGATSLLLPHVNDKVAKLKAANPDLAIDDLTPEGLDQRAIAKSKAARDDFHEMQAREKTLGGSLGSLTGAASGSLTDPFNLVLAPLAAPEGLGLLATVFAWGAIGGGSQAAIEAIGSPYRETVSPGYGASGEPARNVMGAAAFGGAAGGFFKGLGMAWGRAKTGVWPRSIRDAGNVVESEAQVARSNVLPGLEGEVAHRDALAKTIDDVVAGRRVDVPDSVTTPQEPTGPGFDVHHGSPHSFDRFDSSKIGTGEGAQSYGHGLYLAENPEVAQTYGSAGTKDRPVENAAREALADHGNRENAIAALQKEVDTGNPYIGGVISRKAVIERLKSDQPLESNLYRVRINADKEAFLDLDKNLNEQTPEIQTSVKRAMGIDHEGKFDQAKSDRLWNEFQSANGRRAVRQGFIAFDDVTVANRLREAGVPGLKYLDSSSRKAGEGTRNFVLFDDKLAQITHKNGEPLSLFDAHEARVDMMMDERAGSRAAAEEAKAAPVEPAPELPLEPTTPELHEAAIADGVQNIARMAGHDMPREEAERVAKMVAGASDDERARAILSAVFDRPQTVAEFPPSPLPKAREGELAGSLEPKTVDTAVASPEFEQALRADIDRARATGDVKIPAGVDEKGEPVFRSVDAAMNEIDAYKAAAEQIKACANPQPEPAEAA